MSMLGKLGGDAMTAVNVMYPATNLIGSTKGGLNLGMPTMLGGGSGGGAWQAAGAGLQVPATTDQATSAYNNANNGLAQQQAFLQALQAQNGVANQSSVYNQLQGIANGTGPNPAQAMLNQSTGSNIAAQSALMAGQRGAGSNTGLIARQAAQQGAATQQQAVGQGATMQANQSLNALSGMGSLATQQVGQQQGAITGYNQAAQSEQQNLLNAIASANQAQATVVGGQNAANSAIQVQNAKGQQGLMGGVMSGIGSAMMMAAKGGVIEKPRKKMADGGDPGANPDASLTTNTTQPLPNQPVYPSPGQPPIKSSFAKFVNGFAPPGGDQSQNGQTPAGNTFFDSANGENAGASSLTKGLLSALKSSVNTDPNKGIDKSLTATDQPIATGYNGFDPSSGQIAGPPAPFSTSAPNNPGADQVLQQDNSENQKEADQVTQDAEASNSSPMPGMGSGGSNMPDPAAAAGMAKGGKVKALLSPGEVYLSPKKAKEVAIKGKNPVKEGKHVPGKAKVPGDSYDNDTFPTTLQEGGVVIPRSVMQSKDPAKAAHAFVTAVLAKHNMKKKA